MFGELFLLSVMNKYTQRFLSANSIKYITFLLQCTDMFMVVMLVFDNVSCINVIQDSSLK